MTHNDILMANGWLHEQPAEVPQPKQPAQKEHTPLFHRINEVLLAALRASHRCLDRSMMRIERKLCEQLA